VVGPTAKLRFPDHRVRAPRLPDESRYGENRGKKCLSYVFKAMPAYCCNSPTRRPDTQRWVLPYSLHVFPTCFCQLLLPFLLLPVASFWYFRELRTSLITRSFLLLCIPCWLSAPRTRSICFFFCLLPLMYCFFPPWSWFHFIRVLALRVNSAFASNAVLVEYVEHRLLNSRRFTPCHSFCLFSRGSCAR
jgi:hypothetical protein